MFRIETGSNSSSNLGCAGRAIGSFVFLLFFFVGSTMTFVVAREAYRNARSHSWPTVECEILSSGVHDVGGEDPYQIQIAYRYTYDGEQYTSERYSFGGARYSSYNKAQRLADRFPAGGKARCYVNPENPTEAILQPQSPMVGFVCLFTVLFAVIGAGGLYLLWFGGWRPKQGDQAKESISKKAPRPGKVPSAVWRGLLFGIFFLVGGVLSYFFTVLPVSRALAARRWQPTPCKVISSTVREHSSDDGYTYSIDILYEYEVNGKRYRSNRYDLLGVSSSGYERKAAVVRQHPPGRETTCFVNPKDPHDAVLKRGLSPILLFGLIPLLFLVIGAAGLVHMLRHPDAEDKQHWTKTEPARGGRPIRRRAIPDGAAGPVILEAKGIRVAKFVGMAILALIWNGICSFLFADVAAGWQKGHPNYFETLFAIPFLLVGLALIGGGLYFLLAMFNPWPRIRLSTAAAPLGAAVDIEWEMKGQVSNLSRLR
ncbi:MAG: DUF3592 domain-containing protein, partial [Candidatus Sumerlaeia bacterium]|nr:DUF3592 domain-containing protein [Candidatus Sumerlaeia bacterium]